MAVLDRLACPDFPLLEKLNCFILYQQWSSRRNLPDAAASIGRDCQSYLNDRDARSRYHDQWHHRKYDLLAQLRRECGKKQLYVGFDTILSLAWGNPRHLLILLKHIHSWAVFRDERPFGGRPISIKAQVEGVKEAAAWFFRDARMTGKDGKSLQDGISRLGTLFRSVRYSDKPSECSLSTFSYEPASVSEETLRLIKLAEQCSLLVNVGVQRDRNSERVDMKYQLNRMLASRWDISPARRGALAMSGDDVNAIFDSEYTDQFDGRLKSRIERMTAPFFGIKPTTRSKTSSAQGTLGLDRNER